MARFLALFIGSVSAAEKADYSPTADEEASWANGMTAWGQWIEKNSGVIVDHGTPLGKTLRASPNGVEPKENRIVAYIVVEADDHQTAADMFKSHPHFSIMPGDSIEIMECLQIPGNV